MEITIIQGALSLFPSLTSFNSAFGHSPFRLSLEFSTPAVVCLTHTR